MNNQNHQDIRLPVDRKIGINKIGEMPKQPYRPFVLYVGPKKLVKRKAFEAYIDGKAAI